MAKRIIDKNIKMKRTFRDATDKAYKSPLFIVLFVLLVIYSLCLILPITWGIMQSLQDGDGLFEPIPWPLDFKFSNFSEAFTKFFVPVVDKTTGETVYPTMIHMFTYSIIYAVGSALFATFVPCLVGYLTARYNYFFSKIVNTFVIIAIALPIVGSLPSEIQMAQNLGLYNTLYGIWIMKGHFLSIYYLIFYARFKTIPASFEEAARIDGANQLKIFTRIMLPLAKDLFLTVFLLQFIAFWNDYYTPLMYMPSYPTIAYGMWYYNASTDNAITSIPMKIAGCMLMLIPILVLFLVFSNRLMSNLTEGGEKE